MMAKVMRMSPPSLVAKGREPGGPARAAPWTAIEAEIKTGRLALLNLQAPPLYSRAGIMHLRGRTLLPAARMFMAEATKPVLKG